MNEALAIHLEWQDWLYLFLHYLSLSLLSFGGAMATAPEMHRYLVEQHSYLNEMQFNASISIAQAAPGPNILFVALMGWNVGLNAGGMGWGLMGVLLTMTGMLLPSATLTYVAARWGHRNRDLPSVRALKQGMMPIIVSLFLATSWIMISAQARVDGSWILLGMAGITTLIVWRTKIHLLWLLLAGGCAGWFGLV